MPAYTDEQLVLEVLDDSHQAFEQLVKQYQYSVLRTIASIVSDEQAAQDVAQETFLTVWRDLAKLKERHKFGRWLNQIAINLSKLWLRDQRKHNENKVPLDENVAVLTQELSYQRDKLRQAVWEAIDELTADYREAVILHYISGYSYKEMGEMLSVPISTVRGRLQEARNQLRKEFLDMVTKLQLEIDSTLHNFLREHAEQDGVSIGGLIIRLIERYKRDIDNPEMAVRKMAMMDVMGAPSPDGRYISYTDWDTGDLAIHEIATGKKRRLTNKGSWDESDEFAQYSRWSPDSKQIVYDWDNGNGVIDLCIVGLDGSKPRILYSNEEVIWAQTYDWSPDRKQILACFSRKDGSNQIVLVSVADGSVRVLKTLGRYYPENMCFSPDGRYIVYDFPQKEDSPEHDISLLSTDGSREIPLVEYPSHDTLLGWAPDGENILFASDRTGTLDAWVIQVADGKPQGAPKMVKQDIGRPMGFTRDGSFYYGCGGGWIHDVYVTKLDPETGEILVSPHEAINGFVESNSSPDYSPDGKYLAYISIRPPLKMRNTSWPIGNVLCIRSLETGEEREFKPEINSFGFPRWSPDSRSIMVVNWEHGNKHMGHYRIDAQTGEVRLVVMSEVNTVQAHEWCADGKSIFLVRSVQTGYWDKNLCQIVVRDIESGAETELYRASGSGAFTISRSPDGKWLAFLDRYKKRTLRVISATGGGPREIHLFDQGDNRRIRHSWTANGKYILMPELRPPKADGKWDLWRIPVEGGEPKNFGFEMAEVWQLTAHPDGQHIAFSTTTRRPGEVWVIENFLPGFTAAR